jgi:hypothetical protein
MANGRFNTVPPTTTMSDLDRINENWQIADSELTRVETERKAEDASLLVQIIAETAARILAVTTEEQNRINADNAHANAGTAHQAGQISYDGAKSIKQRLDELIAQVGNILVEAGSGNDAIDDMRLGADGVARQYPGLLIREIHAQQLEADIQSVTLKHGLNII